MPKGSNLMPRYFTRAKALWVEDENAWDAPVMSNIPTVCDHDAIDTGLLNADGNTIMRAPNPIGFGKDDEW